MPRKTLEGWTTMVELPWCCPECDQHYSETAGHILTKRFAICCGKKFDLRGKRTLPAAKAVVAALDKR